MRKFNMPVIKLEEAEFLQGCRLEFESIAEMITVRAHEKPDAPHVYFYDDIVTYKQTNERANKIANYLKTKRAGKGDNVAVMVLNSPEVFYAMFGAHKLGAVPLAVNYMLKPPEIAYVLDDAQPKAAFVGSEFMADFAQGYKLAKHKPAVVEVATGVDHGADIAAIKLTDILSSYPADEALVKQSPEDPFMLLYSSGTTGMPKGILLTNKGELSICRDMNRIGLFNGDDVMMIILPMFHANSLCVWTYPVTFAGGALVIRKTFLPDDFWPSLTRYGVTVGMAVPYMYDYVYRSVDPQSVDLAKLKLRYAFSGAAPLKVELIRGFKEKYNVDIVEGYGLAEVSGVSTSNPPLGKKKIGSIGMSFPEQLVEIMDDDNHIMPLGKRGEICTWGDANMLRYLNNADATRETVKDGWLHTGDVGYMDEEGYIYIVDRKKDMICRGDENIYPREIEIVLESHPKIAEAAVIGVPDQALGERVKAFIIPKVEGSITEQEIKDFLADQLAEFKIPEFIEFRTDFPRGQTGKLLKKELRK
ncbi:MAG TPA: AMP-binding protein [Syntrophomonas sp.]|nr:AMP-binding protein [Syntrophomonas sp.]